MIFSSRIFLTRICKSLLSKLRFRGKGTLLLAVCPRSGCVEIELFGMKFECDLSDHIQRSIFLFDYDEEAVTFIKSRISAGDVFFDIGANVGFYSYLASSLVGDSGRVFAIEPNPVTFAKLQRSIERNRIKNIQALNCGLSSEAGSLKLYLNIDKGNATATMVPHENSDTITVPVRTLSEVVTDFKIDKIAYLKIDVDGFEPEVFRGAKELLANGSVSAVQSEFCDYWLKANGSSADLLHSTLIDAGFYDIGGVPKFKENCIVDRFFLRKELR